MHMLHVVSAGDCVQTVVLPSHVQVDHPEKYGFNPKELLNHLTDIYLHLGGEVLARAIATDERSYRKELFETCTDLLRNKNIKNEVDCVWRCEDTL